MQINDDDIRAAFKWPVRYDTEGMYIRNDDGILFESGPVRQAAGYMPKSTLINSAKQSRRC